MPDTCRHCGAVKDEDLDEDGCDYCGCPKCFLLGQREELECADCGYDMSQLDDEEE